ncbi:unnamed protein product [Ilex paraguariensis]|uniref:PI4-kinase N-terminal domain-containing protein n=1 Tax=Ilex paraguariensis TaxID=185542 RepID=A0ABC8UGY6_9AQUA
MLAFLKIWKRDWTELGQLLKVRINTELSVYQAAAGLQIKSLSSVDLNGKSSKRLCIVDRSSAACLAHSLQTPRDKYCARVHYLFASYSWGVSWQRLGADFLGPLLLAVAEICSDFDPTVYVEPALLKLFRNLWFYVTLFGLAPPIQKTLYMYLKDGGKTNLLKFGRLIKRQSKSYRTTKALMLKLEDPTPYCFGYE